MPMFIKHVFCNRNYMKCNRYPVYIKIVLIKHAPFRMPLLAWSLINSNYFDHPLAPRINEIGLLNQSSHLILYKKKPVHVTNAPVHVTNAPVHVTNAPAHVTNAPVHVTNAPAHVTNAPAVKTIHHIDKNSLTAIPNKETSPCHQRTREWISRVTNVLFEPNTIPINADKKCTALKRYQN